MGYNVYKRITVQPNDNTNPSDYDVANKLKIDVLNTAGLSNSEDSDTDSTNSLNYYNIINSPITLLISKNKLNYINLGGLTVGHYAIEGYYRKDLTHTIEQTGNNGKDKVEMYVYKDTVSEYRTLISYITVEDSQIFINKLIYNNGILVKEEKSPIDGMLWQNIDN